MAARVYYFVKRDGHVTTYYSRYGANSVPWEFLYGYVKLERSEQLITEDSEERYVGGDAEVLIDVDKRRILFFGYDFGYVSFPWQRRVLLKLMGATLKGQSPHNPWTIHWAPEACWNLGEAAGLFSREASMVCFDLHPDNRSLHDLMLADDGPCIFTLQNKDGSLRDVSLAKLPWQRGFDLLVEVLVHGEKGLCLLASRSALPALPSERDVHGGAFIDERARHISIWMNSECPRDLWHVISTMWPGWTVGVQDEGFPRQVSESGRDAERVTVPPPVAFDEMRIAIEASQGDEFYDLIGKILYDAGWADTPGYVWSREQDALLEWNFPLRTIETRRAHAIALMHRAVSGESARWPHHLCMGILADVEIDSLAVLKIVLALMAEGVEQMVAAPSWLTEAKQHWRSYAELECMPFHEERGAIPKVAELAEGTAEHRQLVLEAARYAARWFESFGPAVPYSELVRLGTNQKHHPFTSDQPAEIFMRPARALIALLSEPNL